MVSDRINLPHAHMGVLISTTFFRVSILDHRAFIHSSGSDELSERERDTESALGERCMGHVLAHTNKVVLGHARRCLFWRPCRHGRDRRASIE